MIRQLTGALIHKSVSEVVILCGGVGYAVETPANTPLPAIGERLTLWTHLRVREDALDLFGFATREELLLFESMQRIRRFPAKTALAVLSHCGVDGFRRAVATGDVDALTRVPGIGKKSAQQVLLEMRGQIDLSALPGAEVKSTDDVTLALVELGFTEAEARVRSEKARAEHPQAKDPAEIIRIALRKR